MQENGQITATTKKTTRVARLLGLAGHHFENCVCAHTYKHTRVAHLV